MDTEKDQVTVPEDEAAQEETADDPGETGLDSPPTTPSDQSGDPAWEKRRRILLGEERA